MFFGVAPYREQAAGGAFHHGAGVLSLVGVAVYIVYAYWIY